MTRLEAIIGPGSAICASPENLRLIKYIDKDGVVVYLGGATPVELEYSGFNIFSCQLNALKHC